MRDFRYDAGFWRVGQKLFQAFTENSTASCDALPSGWREKVDAGLDCAREALGTDTEVPTTTSHSRGGFLFQGQLSGAEPEHNERRGSGLEAEYGAFMESLLTNANPGTASYVRHTAYDIRHELHSCQLT
eukprot:969442-Prorocentrum_minimum.AAC.2